MEEGVKERRRCGQVCVWCGFYAACGGRFVCVRVQLLQRMEGEKGGEKKKGITRSGCFFCKKHTFFFAGLLFWNDASSCASHTPDQTAKQLGTHKAQ